MNLKHLIKRNASALSIFALLFAADVALGQSAVYEGFNYTAGPRNPATLNGGVGWSGAYTADQPSIPVSTSSLTAPAALPTSGGSVRWTTSNQAIGFSRNFAVSFPATAEVWMSFITRRDNLPSSWVVRLGGVTGPGVGDGVQGIHLYRGDGTQAVMTGLHGNSQAFTLVRFGAPSAGVRTISVWSNPAPGSLGAPTASTSGPATALGSAFFALGLDTSIDEFRADTNLANVFVPAPGAVMSVGIPALAFAVRRRRGVERVCPAFRGV